MRCEDYPACGHEPGGCPYINEAGEKRFACARCDVLMPPRARRAVCAFCTSSRDALVHLEHVRVHWLNRAACLVAKIQRAFVLPLRSAFDTAIKAESFPIGVNNLEATETSVCHNYSSRSQPLSESDGSSS